MRFDIFLSYSSRDTEFASRIYSRLRRFRAGGRPLSVFFAPESIDAGAPIVRTLSEALDSSSHLVAVVTPDWLDSEWCRLEEEVAIWRDSGNGGRVVIPLKAADCRMPSILDRLQFIDFRESADFERSLREIVAVVRKGVERDAETARQRLERYRDEVLAASVLPWLTTGGPNFDFVWPEMIVDPLVRPRKHPGPAGRRLSGWLAGPALAKGACVAVVGNAGAGKTTTLRTMLLSGSGPFPDQRIFVHARDLAARIDGLETEIDPSGQVTVFVDGLDEVGSIDALAGPLARLRGLRATVLFASRTEFFERQYALLSENLGELTEVLEVLEWGPDDIMEFTRRYAERIDDGSVVHRVRRLLGDRPEVTELIGNPMRLTLLLFLVGNGAPLDPGDLAEPYGLYRVFYDEWLRKERHRGTGGFSAAAVRRTHVEVARRLYRDRDTPLVLEAAGPGETPDLLEDTAFTELLTFAADDDGARVVRGFRHETLGEFLIAQHILTAFAEGGPAIDAALDVTVVDDVNAFVRSGMLAATPRVVDRHLRNLTARYEDLLAEGAAPEVREQLLYYIGRLPVGRMPGVLKEAFGAETIPLLRRAAAVSCVVQGDHEVEAAYLEMLEAPAEALLNRSVQMVYFGDVFADLHTFRDSGEDWSKTRGAIYRRLAAHSLRDIRLRLWDLRTLRGFYESRGEAPTDEERAALAEVVTADPETPERGALLAAELARVRGITG